MEKAMISKETEEKRLKDFQKIAENWDILPEYAQGRIDGVISMTAAFTTAALAAKKAG